MNIIKKIKNAFIDKNTRKLAIISTIVAVCAIGGIITLILVATAKPEVPEEKPVVVEEKEIVVPKIEDTYKDEEVVEPEELITDTAPRLDKEQTIEQSSDDELVVKLRDDEMIVDGKVVPVEPEELATDAASDE
jgi:hypothetical protein